MPRPLRDSLYIYGFHDPGGEQIMLDAGAPGWVLVTEAIGSDPNNRAGVDYRRYSDRELGVVVRLNNGYNPGGTLPYEREYGNFARRCANFVAASPGAHLWIIGNEPNHPIEWPGAQWNWGPGWPAPISPNTRGEEITPARYASAYKQCRAAIKALPGHANDQVLVAGPAPWNILLTYPANPNGDWVKYFTDTLAAIGAGNLDGITLHTYTHGASPALVTSEEKMTDPRFTNRRFQFRAYMDFMAAIPSAMRGLPVYITEANQGDQAWENANNGWVRAAYAEIDRWNRANAQKIRSLLLYRWPQVPGDRWGIEGKAGVIDDFRGSLAARYQWSVGEDAWTALTRRVTELEAAAAALAPAITNLSQYAADAATLRRDAEALLAQINALKPAELTRQLDALEAQIKALETAMTAPNPGGPPQIIDKVGQLPVGTGAPYPTRNVSAIKRVVVHHTVTPADVTPERLAQAAVSRGLPGIQYHYLVSGNGTVYAVQPHTAVVTQTNKPEVNADSLGVALAGDFTNVAPPPAQLESAAQLIADLLLRYRLTTAAVVGRRELEATASPGNQWLAGARYKDTLLARVQAIMDAAADPATVELRRRIAELEAQVTGLHAQVTSLTRDLEAANQQKTALQGQLTQSQAQATALQTRITQLETTVAQQAAEIQRLRDQLAGTAPGVVAKPAVVDMVDKLPKHPTLPPYSKRTKPISMIVVHHTDTPGTMTVQSIAQYHVYGERKDAQGNVIKAQWPGIGYHFLIDPAGVIYQGQREATRSYHVGGDPNDFSVAISLIGRFMRKNYDGTDRAVADQTPTPAQLRSAGRLAAWLMQEYKVKEEQVKGHRDVWPKSTVCPGEHWKAGLNWYPSLMAEIKAAQTGGAVTRRIKLYLLFWDHAPLTGGAAWAEADWRNAQGYIARFRPTAGFSVDDAMLAQRVVIVGGTAGVSGQDETRLRQAGVEVYRLAGANEADTKRMLDELAQKGTPWPGAPVKPVGLLAAEAGPDEVIFPDEWTIPDGWTLPESALPATDPQRPEFPDALEDLPDTPANAPQLPKVFVPPPGATHQEGAND